MTPTQIILAAALTCTLATFTAWALDAWMEARRVRAKALARAARFRHLDRPIKKGVK